MRGVWLHTFLHMYASRGIHTPLTKTGKNRYWPYRIGVSEDYRQMAMTKVYSAAQGGEFHEYVLSYWPNMCETYGGDTSWKPWRMYEQARLCRPMIAKHSICQPQPQHFFITISPPIRWKWRKPKSSKSFHTCVPQTTDQATQNVWQGLRLKCVYFFCRATFWQLPGESLITHQT